MNNEEVQAAFRLATLSVPAKGFRDALTTLQPYHPDERLSAEEEVQIMDRVGRLFSLLYGSEKTNGG